MSTGTLQLISDAELMSINEALLSKYGYDFSGYENSSLKRRLSRIMHKFELGNTIELWKKLLYDPDFAIKFKDEISVGLTEMFRNPDLWQFMREQYMPKFIGQDKINIWHAGCSTGEEVYSMAIMMKEFGLLNNTKAIATDLSDRFVKQSAEGIFESDLLEKYRNNYEASGGSKKFIEYFNTVNTESKQAIPELRNYATFMQHNLVKDTIDTKFDIIFCRNVMIYFNDPLKLKVLDLFTKSLKPDGIFIIGYFDSLPNGYEQYFQYYNPSFKIFKHKCI